MKKSILIIIFFSACLACSLFVSATPVDRKFMQLLYDKDVVSNLDILENSTIAFRIAELLDCPYAFNVSNDSYSLSIYKYAIKSTEYVKEGYYKLSLYELKHNTDHHWIKKWSMNDSTNSLPQYFLAIRSANDGHTKESLKYVIKGNKQGISVLRPLYLALPEDQFSIMSEENIKYAKIECISRALPLISSFRYTIRELSKYIYKTPVKSDYEFNELLKFTNILAATRPVNFVFFEAGISMSKEIINDRIENDPYLNHHDRNILIQTHDAYKKLIRSVFADITDVSDEKIKTKILDKACKDLIDIYTRQIGTTGISNLKTGNKKNQRLPDL